MTTRRLIGAILLCALAAAQEPPDAPAPTQPMQNGTDAVTVNADQPYRPIPVGRPEPRETIWEFYLRALNPRQIRWGNEIDRRLAVLAEQSIGNPYFRVCAFQMGLILFLLMICWLWWDKTRQIKWLAAECLTDAINAKRIADHKALEAIGRYNRHIEMCNRVIENEESGLAIGSGSEHWQRDLHDLQTQLATERAKSASLEADRKNRAEIQAKLESRVQQLERTMLDRQGGVNAELVARLQRAEAELGSRKTPRR